MESGPGPLGNSVVAVVVRTGALVIAALLAGSAAWFWQRPRARWLSSGLKNSTESQALAKWQPISVLLVALGVWSVLDGWLGLAVGVLVGWWVQRWLSSLPRAASRRRQRERQTALPIAVDLLSACLSAGASQLRGLQVVGDCVEASVGQDLRRVALALEVGGSPDEAWALVAGGDLVAVAALMQRCAWSGAPVAVLLGDLARDMREQVRAEALAEASALGVRSAGPLGVCFLPAFILIGVVPLVIGLFEAWL